MAGLKKGELTTEVLLDRYKKGDIESRNKLIERYIKYAKKIASEYYDLGTDNDDILSAAIEGILLGLESKKTKKTPKNLTSYLITRIRQNIILEIMKNYGYYAKSYRVSIIKLLKAKRDLTLELDREPTIEELSKRTNINVFVIDRLLKIINFKQNEDLNNLSYETLDLVRNGIVNTESLVIHKELITFLESILYNSNMKEKEKIVLIYRFLEEDYTQEKLASYLNLSITRIQQIEFQALKKIRRSNINYFLDLASSKDESTRIDVKGLSYKKR